MLRVLTILAMLAVTCGSLPGQDSVRTYVASEVVVHADALLQPWRLDRPVSTSASVDELMRHGGLTLVQRASGFAGEVTMMGLRGTQVNTTIDGMKIHSACVDKMDPNTAYIEVDNVSTMQLNSSGSDLRYGQTLGGAVNFRLQQPRYASPLSSIVDATLESNTGRRLRMEMSGGSEDYAFRIGYTVRGANDMIAGNGSMLPLSGYAKQNLHVSLGYKPTSAAEIEAMVILDHAADVGYPSLLMDTRTADAVIGSITWRERWSSSLRSSVKLYANDVYHVMDDFDRPVAQVQQRRFMPGMYMPMHGTARVYGALLESTMSSSQTAFTVTIDATLQRTAATMDMIPLDRTITPMHMSNLGDVSVGNLGISVMVDHAISCDVSLQGAARLDAGSRTINDDGFRSMLSGYYPTSSFASQSVAPSVSLGATWNARESLQMSFVVGYAQRMPTPLELYGFMLYDPQSNIVAYGNPDLRNEQALSATAQITQRWKDVRLTGSMYLRTIDNYIAPDPRSTSNDNSGSLTRTIGNVGSVILSGFDLTCTAPLASWLTMQGMVRGCRGQNLTWNDPLPLIDPLRVTLRAIMGDPTMQLEVQATGAVRQGRVSQLILSEDTTSAWWTASVLLAWQPISMIRLQVSATNIMNAYYHEHTSINNMPARGRSLNIGMRVQL